MGGLEEAITEIRSAEEEILCKLGISARPKDHFDLTSVVVRPVFFSDSVLIVSSDDSPASANKMLLACTWLLARCMAAGIPLKGALAMGRQTADFDRSLYFGRPLIDAYELQKELIAYGVILHCSAEKYVKKHKLQDDFGLLVEYQTPLPAGAVAHLLVDWTHQTLESGDPMAMVEKFYSSVSGGARRYVDNTRVYTEYLLELAAERQK